MLKMQRWALKKREKSHLNQIKAWYDSNIQMLEADHLADTLYGNVNASSGLITPAHATSVHLITMLF